MKKRILSLALAVALACGLLSTGALAAGTTETVTINDFTFTMEGVTKKVTKTFTTKYESAGEITVYVIPDGGGANLTVKYGGSVYPDVNFSIQAYNLDADGKYSRIASSSEDFFLRSDNSFQASGALARSDYKFYNTTYSKPGSLVKLSRFSYNGPTEEAIYFQFESDYNYQGSGTPVEPTQPAQPQEPAEVTETIVDGDITYTLSGVISKAEKHILVDGLGKDVTVYMFPDDGAAFAAAFTGAGAMGNPAILNEIIYSLAPNGLYYNRAATDKATTLSAAAPSASWGSINDMNAYAEMFGANCLCAIELEGTGNVLYYQFEGCVTDVPATPAAPTVAPSPCAATLDGKAINLNAYLFTEGNGGTNYVMLRDVAYLLNGTKAQFEVKWDKNTGIAITTGNAYTPVGGELVGKGDGSKTYTANTSAITIDGKTVDLTAYTIEGNNYFKLRDLGTALGFAVDWDGTTGTVKITSSK